MKLVRFRHGGSVRLGAIIDDRVIDIEDAQRTARQATVTIPSSMRAFLAAGEPALQAAREAVDFATAHSGLVMSQPVAETELLAPVGDPQKIVCVGQNYRDHCEEQNQPIPERAILFAKFPTALTGPGADIVLPKLSEKVDYEAELAFVIGRGGKDIPESSALEHVAGYMCLNDVSARDIQFGDGQWVRAKTFDTFAPCGPALVTADEVGDPHKLDIRLTLNGQVMQSSNTKNLIFGVGYLVSYLSQVMTLEPGDIVTTGTPGGVGVWRKPPVFLKPGDTVTVEIERVGTLTNQVVAAG